MRGISLEPDQIVAHGEGVNIMRDRIPVLSQIRVRYELTIPSGSRETVDRALSRHVDKCPTAQSLKGAVSVSWEAAITEV